MFKRGNRIMVVESTASGRSHPAVGDIGYLNNMFFFYRDRFILADAYFFHYKKDSTSKDRCEKKRFIIDMGIKKHFKAKLMSVGIPTQFFTLNSYKVNLTPVVYHSDSNCIMDVPNVIGPYGIWTRKHKTIKHTDTMLNRLVKLPLCHIALASNIDGAKYDLATRSHNEVSAWFKSLIPVMSLASSFGSNIADVNNIHGKIVIAHGKMSGCLLMRLMKNGHTAYSMKPTLKRKGLSAVIRSMRQIQMLSEFLMEESDAHIINTMGDHFMELKKYWKVGGLEKVVTDGHRASPFSSGLPFIFLRGLMMSSNTRNSLEHMLKYIPWGNSTNSRMRKVSTAYVIGKEADNNSAALNRFFEEELIK